MKCFKGGDFYSGASKKLDLQTIIHFIEETSQKDPASDP